MFSSVVDGEFESKGVGELGDEGDFASRVAVFDFGDGLSGGACVFGEFGECQSVGFACGADGGTDPLDTLHVRQGTLTRSGWASVTR